MLILILMTTTAGMMAGGLLGVGMGWALWAVSSLAILGGMAGTLLGGAMNYQQGDPFAAPLGHDRRS